MTVEAACYLLFSHSLQSFEAVLLLAPVGFNHQIIELLRGIREAIDLAVLFMYEGQNGDNLKSWFAGEIISNDVARKAFEKFINEGRESPLAVADIKSAMYGGFSQFNHMSYTGLYESIDVFSRDFDISRIAGLHYITASTLPFAMVQVQSMLVALKQFYWYRQDRATISAIDELLGPTYRAS
jgi:hypothetical protein